MFGKKKAVDERIRKRTNELFSGAFPFVWGANAVFLILKAVLGLPVIVYALEILALVAGTAVRLIEGKRYGTLFVKEKDDALKELSEKAGMEACYTMFWIAVIGELLFIFLVEDRYFFWVLSYFAIWFPACLVISIIGLSEGLLAFGSAKQEKMTKKKLGVGTLIGAIVFGAFIGVLLSFTSGSFNPKGLLWIPVFAAVWGIPYYFLMTLAMKKSDKNADKIVEQCEAENEE